MIALSNGSSTGEIVRSLDAGGLIVSTTHYAVAECAHGMHFHENPHLCLLLQGGDIEVRGSRSYDRRTGDLFFYRAGEAHASLSRQRSTTNAFVEFDWTFLDRYGLSESQLENAVQENLNAKFLLLKMQKELRTDDIHTPLALHALALEIVNYSRVRYERTPPRWVEQLTELLHESWDRRPTLTELAIATGTHPVTISKQFRKYFSCTLGEYQRRLMIGHSIRLIKDSPMTLSEIAFRCGFADQSHFTRSFRQITGFLPRDFRRR